MDNKLKTIPFGTNVTTINTDGGTLSLELDSEHCIVFGTEEVSRDLWPLTIPNIVVPNVCMAYYTISAKEAISAENATLAHVAESVVECSFAAEASSATSTAFTTNANQTSSVSFGVLTLHASLALETPCAINACATFCAGGAAQCANTTNSATEVLFAEKSNNADEAEMVCYATKTKSLNSAFQVIDDIIYDKESHQLQIKCLDVMPNGSRFQRGYSVIPGGQALQHL